MTTQATAATTTGTKTTKRNLSRIGLSYPSRRALDVLHRQRVLADLQELRVGVDHALRLALHLQLALVHPDGGVAEVGDRPEGVRDQHDRPTAAAQLAHLPCGLLAEARVADGERLI